MIAGMIPSLLRERHGNIGELVIRFMRFGEHKGVGDRQDDKDEISEEHDCGVAWLQLSGVQQDIERREPRTKPPV